MSKQINRSIIIDAKVKTTLEDMNKVVSKLNQGLRDGTTKVDLTKGVGSSLSKQLDKFKDEYSKFSKYIEGDKIEFADSKDAIKSGEALIKTFKEMRRIVGDFDNLTVLDAKKLFPDAFDSKVSDLLKGLNGLSTAMTKLEAKQLDLSTAQTEMGELTREAERFQNLIDQEVTLKLELEKARTDLEHFDSEIEAIRAKAAKGITLKINTAAAAQNEAKKDIEEIEAARSSRGFNQEDFSGTTTRTVKFKGKTEKQWKDESTKKDASEASKAEAATALEAIRVYRQEENALKDLNAVLQARKKEVDSLRESLANINNMKISQAVEMAGGTTEEINEANTAMQVYAAAAKEASEAQGRYNTAVSQAKGASDKLEKTNAALETQQAKIDKITLEIGELNKEVSTEALEKAFSTAGIEDFSAQMLKSTDGIEKLRTKLNELDDKRLKALKLALSDIGLGADKAEDYVEQLRGTLSGVRDTADDIKKSASEMENLKNQVLQFFSLTNSVQLFKRAVTKAMNTVKELDATMTEAAVVTEFDVGDMWDKLPQYSVEAQKLGVSINGMYQATTLYYQQGLKNNEAMALGVETMKMAKIAGLETADATKAMTAALRGFNMELNETSATRVNDVYSQLAAVTAADVSQISTAMEKTASIAASANMEFETTAALLAQIIETTQEAPETAGTAMKTIIARFSEVKNLKSQGQTTGKDSEGEEIDVNKIQTALRTVGISMDGFFAGTEGLDSVLLKLAEKWEGLDFETQRYIATMAAGSRQQSRFIAMMSDYGRTTELVGEAQNSAGASQRQYEKTLDSMESKLQKLENAWNQFLMGLTNNTILKGAVDGLIFIIEGINKLTDAISGGNGLAKSIVSLTTVVGALKLGKGLLGGGLGWAGGKLGMGAAPTKETVTETGPDGQTTVKTIVKEPYKEGQQSGQQAGQGFLAGFKNAIASKKEGGSALKGFFTTGKNEARLEGKIKGRDPITKKGKEKREANQKAVAQEKDIFMQSVKDNNKDNANFSDKNLDEISNVYDDIIQKGGNAKQAAEGANAAIGEMGGQLGTVGENAQNTSLGLQGATLNMGALGGAVSSVGGVLGLLASLFEELGLEEWVEPVATLAAVFMGLGSVMSLLSTIAPALGMSFTTAGVQITTAGVTSQLAWWWVFLIIAAVALLVVGVIALAKAAKKASLEGRMEAAAKATEQAKEAAEAAKQAYDDLLSSRNDYTETQNALSELTRGTDEWKEALMEANQQVLQLLSTYPQLAQYLGRGEEGQLTISDEGWDSVIDQQQKAVQNSSALVLRSQMKEVKLQQEAAERTMQKQLVSRSTYYDSEGYQHTTDANDRKTSDGVYYEKDILDKLYEAYKENPEDLFKIEDANADMSLDSSYSTTLQEIAAASDYTAEELWNMQAALGDYDAALVSSQAQLEKTAEAMIMTNFSEEVAAYEYSDEVAAAFSKQVSSAAYTNKEKARKDEIYQKDGSAEKDKDGKFAELAREYNVSNKMVGDDLKDLQTLYASMAGIAVTDIPEDIKENKDALAQAIAEMDVANDLAEGAEKFALKLQTLEKSHQRQAAALLSGEVGSATLKDINHMESINSYSERLGYSSVGEMAKDLGYTDMALNALDTEQQKKAIDYLEARGAGFAEAGYVDANGNLDYTKIIADYGANNTFSAEDQLKMFAEESEEKIRQAYDDAFSQAKAYGLDTSMKSNVGMLNSLVGGDGFTLEQTEQLASSLSQVALGGGNATKTAQVLGSLTQGLTGNDLAAATSIIADTDWSNGEEIENSISALESLGVQIDDNLVDQIYSATNAVKKFDLSKFEEKLKSLDQVAKLVSGKIDDSANSFTKEERDALIAQGVGQGQFLRLGFDEFVFMGDTNALLAQINDKVGGLLQQSQEDLKYSVERGASFEKYFQTGGKVGDLGNIPLEKAFEGLASGEYTANETKDDTADTFGRDTLEKMAKGIGLDKQMNLGELSNQGIKDALVKAYKDYWVTYDTNLQNYKTTLIDNASIGYAEKAGTAEMSGIIDKGAFGKKSSELDFASFQHVFDVNGTFEKLGITDVEGAIRAISTGDLKLDAWSTDWVMKTLGIGERDQYGQVLGTTSEKQTMIAEYYNRTILPEDTLNAYIDSQAGLGIAVEHTTEQLKQQGVTLAADSLKIKNLVAASDKARKGMDKLNGILSDQIDAFKIGDKNVAAYNAALDQVTVAAKEAFGEGITDEFVHTYRDLFAQLAEGGEVAENAFAQIIDKYGTMIMLQKTGFAEGSEAAKSAAQIMNDAFASVEPGAAINLSEYYAKLMAIEGMTEEAAKATMDAWGFSIETTTETAWMKGGIVSKTKPDPIDGWTEFQMVIGTKDTPTGSSFSPSDGSGGSEYENSHDKFYNTYEKVNALLREREQIERRYDQLLKKRSVSAKELLENSRQELANLEAEREQQKKLEAGKLQQIRDLMSKNSKYSQYVTGFNEETGEININWDALESLKNSEKGEVVDEYISELEGLRDQWQEAQDELDSIEDTIIEIRERGKDEYFQLEDQIKEALVNSRQKEIDKLTEINDSINDTNSRILDSMQKQIDEYRQNRENEKTEEEIADKQRKLAYLQMDTSGANATEILQLQKEIEDSQESYTDTLIDQKISELQEQNDLAAEQRQRQIDILQSQLDYYQESGAVWADVYDLMKTDVDENGRLKEESYLAQLLQDAAEYSGLSNLGKEVWQQEIATTFAKAFGYIKENRRAKENDEITFTTADNQTVTGTSDATGNITTEDGKTYTNVHQTAEGDWVTDESYQAPTTEPTLEENGADWNYSWPKPSTGNRILGQYSTGDDVRGLQQALKLWGAHGLVVDGIFGRNTFNAVRAFQQNARGWYPEIGQPDGKVGPRTRKAFEMIGYKTGGLADFTGPAWLDGTKSRPEYILNADQTKVFFQLVDVLSSLQTKPAQTTQNNGDNTYDIDINIESIGSDYDVEQMAETIKRLINEDARYRNNNAINLMR